MLDKTFSGRAPLPSQEEARVAAIVDKQEAVRTAAHELRKAKKGLPKNPIPQQKPNPELDTQYPTWRGKKRTFDDVDEERGKSAVTVPVGSNGATAGQSIENGRTSGTGEGGDPRPRKKKRGGKKQKEKELQWKLKAGIAVPSETIDDPSGDKVAETKVAGQDADEAFSKVEDNSETPHNKSADAEPDDKKSDVNMADADGDAEVEAESFPANTHKLYPSLPPPESSPPLHPAKPSKHAGLPDWLAHPLTISPHITYDPDFAIDNLTFNLSPKVISRLTAQNISHLFPVQAAVLPRLLRTRYSSAPIPPSDLCVSAPTGSGKTLAYALPIVEAMSTRIIPRLRALIILPTRDLAAQVKAVFDSLVKGTDIKVALVTGQTSFTAEQGMVVSREPGEVWTEGEGGSSKVDVLVATPGRLIDHLKETPGFTLRHLRFLVIDEADRLLNQSYHDWLQHVLKAAAGDPFVDPLDDVPETKQPTTPLPTTASLQSPWTAVNVPTNHLGLPLHTVTTHRYTQKSENHAILGHLSHYIPFQKLLFSATLTRNPAKIASLHLHNPTYIAVSTVSAEDNDGETARYVAPATLTEHMLVTATAAVKPLALISLLERVGKNEAVLIFTKSVEAAHRLSLLLQFYDKTLKVEALTSDLTPQKRKRILHDFQSPSTDSTQILITSDILSRGIDPGEHTSTIINYDVPPSSKTYVHRIGRTARAGRDGSAWSICVKSEVRFFKGVWRKVARVGSGKGVKEEKWESGEAVEE
ncbi:ATP-dependent RNA helicase dbp6, partial [Rhizophlyctis rosea]